MRPEKGGVRYLLSSGRMSGDDYPVMIPARKWWFWLATVLLVSSSLVTRSHAAAFESPVNRAGSMGRYVLVDAVKGASVVERFSVGCDADETLGGDCWFRLRATKRGGESYSVWLLAEGYPARDIGEARRSTRQFFLQQGDSELKEYRDRFSGRAVLPSLGGWWHLFPRAIEEKEPGQFADRVRYLGHEYRLVSEEKFSGSLKPPSAKRVELRTDAYIGFPHNTRQAQDVRRFDRSDYEYVRLTRGDYEELFDAGINCVRVDAEQLSWIQDEGTFFWGVGGSDVLYPECLYQSNYLGPAIFLDEPMVGTRDRVIRPRFRDDPEYRRSITPAEAFARFVEHYDHTRKEGAPSRLLSGLAARADVSLGDMAFEQEHVYSWETMVSSAAYQLGSAGKGPPSAIVFEPPGRFGTRRTLPEMNMTYGCQIPADNPKNLASIIYGFLRGAARVSRKDWGMSIYGAVDRADTFWLQTHAYDLGATHFYFWDTYQLACVPYEECLAMARNLSAHAASHPNRDLDRLKAAAEVAIVLPVGYNLGHVQMGKGSLWGVGELNLERRNRVGIPYREVMRNFFVEIERCLRLGVSFDLFWELDGLDLEAYREVVRVKEDGRVEIHGYDGKTVLQGARIPQRPPGMAPELSLELSAVEGKPGEFVARAQIRSWSAPIFYTLGADSQGRYQNVYAAWEIYGPQDEDYRFLRQEGDRVPVAQSGNLTNLEVEFEVDEPGNYRLRVATADIVGRSRVVWREFTVP